MFEFHVLIFLYNFSYSKASNAIKCNLMELTTRSTSHPLCGQLHLNMRMHQDSMCSSPEGVVVLQRLARLYALAFLCAVGAPIIGCPTPPSLPLFHCFTSVTGACSVSLPRGGSRLGCQDLPATGAVSI